MPKTKSKSTVKSDHKKIVQLSKMLKSETNIFDTVVSGNMSTTAIVTNLLLVPQGTAFTERLGLQVVKKALTFRYAIEPPVASLPSSTVRVMYLHYPGSLLNALPSIGQILGTGTNVLSDFNWLLKPNFTVLYDRLHDCSTVEGNSITVQKTINLHNKVATWTSTTGASYDRGAIIQVVLSDQATIFPQFNSYNRITYEP